MNNNDVLRRIRYTFDFDDEKMMKIFRLAEYPATRAEISDWLKRNKDPEKVDMYDPELAAFLTGFIILKRGKKDGEQPKPEKKLTNNIVLRKIKIALSLKNEDIVDIMKLADFKVGMHEITALFRKPDQRQFRKCKDQFLRNFLFGMQLKYRGDDK